nr:golgin subfamily A member 6-like protein 22 isoform X3 [Ipomoea batatas]
MAVDDNLSYPKSFAKLHKDKSFSLYNRDPPFIFIPYYTPCLLKSYSSSYHGYEIPFRMFPRRANNVIVNERQIVNERAQGRTDNPLEKEQVIQSNRVLNGENPESSPIASTDATSEHHADPLDALDVEGDVVMEIEDPNVDVQMEGGAATSSV